MSGSLSPRRLDIVNKHAAECEVCRERIAHWDAEESMIREALRPPTDWSALARKVVERLRRDDASDE